MKTMNTKLLLPLAALALVTAACDPFPAAPGGDPRVVRVIATDQSWTFHSATTENTGSSAGTVAVTDAYPYDTIYVQFNKPMNGLTLQKYADYTANGVKVDPATVPEGTLCAKPANLTTTGFGPDTTFCYYPGSVTDGGQLVITPDAEMVIGTSYTVTGNVQDYEGKSLPISITVTVDPSVTATAVDGLAHPGYGVTYAYGLLVDWFPTGATGYTLEWALDVAAPATPTWSAGISVPNTACVPATDFVDGSAVGYTVCEYVLGSLPPSTDYLFRVGEGAAPTTWQETAASTRGPLPVTLTNFADPAAPSVSVPGSVNLAWGRSKGSLNAAQPYIVERTTDDGAGAPVAAGWTDITATLWYVTGTPSTYIARPLTSTSRSGVDKAATSGTKYWYRVRPNFTAAGAVYEGKASSKVAL